MATSPQRERDQTKEGQRPPPLPARPLRAGTRCRSAPHPHPQALSRSPRSSRSRRGGASPFPPPRHCVWRSWGAMGGVLSRPGGVKVTLSSFCLDFPKSATPVPSRNSGTPLEKWFPAPPRRTPESRAGAGSTPRGDIQAPDRPFGAMADFGGFQKLILRFRARILTQSPHPRAPGSGTSQANGGNNGPACTVDAQ